MPEVDLDKTLLLEPPGSPNGEWFHLDAGTTALQYYEVYRSRAKHGEWDAVTVVAASLETVVGTDRFMRIRMPSIVLSTGAAGTVDMPFKLTAHAGPAVLLDRILLGPGQQILVTAPSNPDRITIVRVEAAAYEKATWLEESAGG